MKRTEIWVELECGGEFAWLGKDGQAWQCLTPHPELALFATVEAAFAASAPEGWTAHVRQTRY